MIHIWMAMDTETCRVLAQDRDWSDGDFPPGPRGAGWPRREHDVDDEVWADLVSGRLTGEEQDTMHRAWWDEVRPTDAPAWPELA